MCENILCVFSSTDTYLYICQLYRGVVDLMWTWLETDVYWMNNLVIVIWPNIMIHVLDHVM